MTAKLVGLRVCVCVCVQGCYGTQLCQGKFVCSLSCQQEMNGERCDCWRRRKEQNESGDRVEDKPYVMLLAGN